MQQQYKRSFVLTAVLATEAALLLVATIWMNVARLDLGPLLRLENPAQILIGLAIGLTTSLSSLSLTWLSRRFKKALAWLNSMDDLLEKHLKPLFGKVNPLDILLISLASGFCEEVFFRGVLQMQFGLVPASIIFALFHFAGPKYTFYVLWSLGAGLLFGALVIMFDSLWIPIAAHAMNNLTSIAIIRYKKS